jgi:hypothetical protein
MHEFVICLKAWVLIDMSIEFCLLLSIINVRLVACGWRDLHKDGYFPRLMPFLLGECLYESSDGPSYYLS